MSAVNKTYLIVILAFSFWNGSAQSVPALERVITISLVNERMESALHRISQEANVTFSYNAMLFNQTGLQTESFTAKTVREVMERIFKGAFAYKEMGNYIILTKAPKAVIRSSRTKKVLALYGYTLNADTGDKLAGVNLLTKNSTTPVTTNEFGYLAMDVSSTAPEILIQIQKENFQDTTFLLTESSSGFVNISLKPIWLAGDTEIIQTSINDSSRLGTQESDSTSTRSVQDTDALQKYTLHTIAQVSVLPFLGTNGRNSGRMINGYSLNVLGGVSMGTRYAEVGGLFNIDRSDVNGLQVAGVFNSVGAHVSGLQAAVVYNVNQGKLTGGQVAGLINITKDSIQGAQLAGLANISAGPIMGGQTAGLVNITTGDLVGTQVAGLANVSTGKITGAQISVFTNYGKNVKGFQLSLINLADSLTGVPIGFFSFVKHGYHKLEFSADEIFYANLAVRSGTNNFFNIITFGLKPENDPGETNLEWSFGYGFGTAPRLTKWLNLNLDITANHLSKGKITDGTNLLNKVFLGLEFQVVKKFSVVVGATLNGYLTDQVGTGYTDIFNSNSPHIFQEHTNSNGTNFMMWWGLKAGIRFF
jgi:hypothetical protein